MLEQEVRHLLEQEERDTVSDAFGGRKSSGSTKSYSVARIRDAILAKRPSLGQSALEFALAQARSQIPEKAFKIILGNLIRFAFLIELTNLKVGSTKMKTRWLPGEILMPQKGSFEPVRGSFEPGNDPRASSFDNCLLIFIKCLNELSRRHKLDDKIAAQLIALDKSSSVPYESVFDYIDPKSVPVHTAANVAWILNEDTEWLLKARPLIKSVLQKKLLDKIQTKTYKTDRALTGKDKTNRAKRWEVLAGDFQHATLGECWSVERRLYEDLSCFQNFPRPTRAAFERLSLIPEGRSTTRCPVTYEALDFGKLTGDTVHGKAEYQVGHLHPLKRSGRHEGENVRWQSADGNRIQGDLTIEETDTLLQEILKRRSDLVLKQ